MWKEIDWGEENGDPSSSHIENEIEKYLDDVAIGSTKALAFHDFYDVHRSFRRMHRRIDKIANPETEEVEVDKSWLRINEMEIALANRDIKKRSSQLEGYAENYSIADTFYENLGFAYFKEYLNNKYREKIEDSVNTLNNRALNFIHDTLQQKLYPDYFEED